MLLYHESRYLKKSSMFNRLVLKGANKMSVLPLFLFNRKSFFKNVLNRVLRSGACNRFPYFTSSVRPPRRP